jgi:mannose-6-phosphate isomerase
MKTVDKPWGYFSQFTENEKTTVKLLFIEKGKRLSYQEHKNRDEFWYVISGHPRAVINNEVNDLIYHETVFIPRKTKHRIGSDIDDAVVLEIAYGKFDEKDIVRYYDDFGRV